MKHIAPFEYLAALRVIAVMLLCTLVGGCFGEPVGASCEITGSGFQAHDNCRHKCLQYREVRCPSGNALQPRVCSGEANCQPGSCPSGQLCYHVPDRFNQESYCVLDDICGTPLRGAEGSAWELASKLRADAARAGRLPKVRKPTTTTARPDTPP
jgi:hypothetical protein